MICQWLILLTCPPTDAKSVVDPHFEDYLVLCSKPEFYVAAFVSSLMLSQPCEFRCSKKGSASLSDGMLCGLLRIIPGGGGGGV